VCSPQEVLVVCGVVERNCCFSHFQDSPHSSDSAHQLGNPLAGGVVAFSQLHVTFSSHKPSHTSAHTALPTAAALEDDANWAVERATSLPEVWALVAENGDGLVDAWRLMSVCRASRG
jgi:hypothetical protein